MKKSRGYGRREQSRLLDQVALSASTAYAGDLEAHLNKAGCWWPSRPCFVVGSREFPEQAVSGGGVVGMLNHEGECRRE